MNGADSSLPPETPLAVISEDFLDKAKELIQTEYDLLLQEKSQPLLAEGKTLEEAMDLIMEETSKATKMDPSSNEVFVQGGWKDPNGDEKVMAESLALEFDTLQEATSTLRKKNEKTESKLAVLTGGFAKRAQNTTAEILQIYNDLQNANIEGHVYSNLRDHEDRGAIARIEQLRSAIMRLRDDEARLQAQYNDLVAPPTAEIEEE
mmetsp:Transcript_13175/g.23022  ORF Transcript_13175/g.23022 Transcript_13175/m.23022 type:complete len:206 (+) Transcript_13175:580-1197(+)